MSTATPRTVAGIRLRRDWRSYAALVLLISLAGGLTLGGIAGARRTATAAERFATETNAYDVLINPDEGGDSELEYDDIAALPMVETAAKVDGAVLLPPGTPTIEELEDSFDAMAVDDAIFRDISVPRIEEGELPDPDDPFGITVSASAAEREGWSVGDEFTAQVPEREAVLKLFMAESEEEIEQLLSDPEYAPEVVLRVDAVVSTLDDLVEEEGIEGPGIHVSRALWDRYGEPSAHWWGAMVTLDDGADVDAFREEVQALLPEGSEETIVFQTGAVTLEKLDRTAAPRRVALGIFALVAGLLGLLLVGQAVSRRLRVEARDNEAWSAMGATRHDRAGMSLWTVLALAICGAVGAVIVAIALSPFTPLGPVRDAEPHPGLAVDGWVLGLGAAVVVIAVVAAAVVPAWRAAASAGANRRADPTRGRVGGVEARPGGAVSTGIRFALDPGHGATSVPTRSTLVGAATGVAIAVVVTVVAASLNHLVDTPRLYGSDWNATLELSLGEQFADEADELPPTVTDALDDDPAVAAWSPIATAQVAIDGTPTQAVAFLSTAKPIEPTIAAGRSPDGADEIALGQLTMDRLGVDVGDTVEVEGDDGSVATATVVGRVILPAIAQYSGSDKTSLGDGALLGDKEADYLQAVIESPLAVQMAPGESVDDLADRLEAMGVGAEASEVARPTDIDSMADLRNTPSALASLLLVLIAFAVCHALFVAARSRRRELGIMQALGATRGNVRLVLVVQALTVAAIACVTGLIAGLFIARWSWQALMDSFGALAEPTAPPLLLAGLLAAVVVLALLASLWPAHRALRESPAEALATE